MSDKYKIFEGEVAYFITFTVVELNFTEKE